ncbi:MAG: prepilin-type N-terminal cleavage/methylation domain-containing protein [Phycisphaeraceae bacterium JB051]
MQHRHSQHKDRHGFTLIELLATLVLCAVVLPVALQAISTSVQLGSVTRDKLVASELAQNKMREILATESWADGDESGEFDDQPRFTWESWSEDWQGSVVKLLHVQIKWTYRGDERTLQLDTLVYSQDDEESAS